MDKNKKEILSQFEQYYSKIEWELLPSLGDAVYYSLDSGGKKLRPLACLLSHQVFRNDVRSSLPVASAIEYFHNFSLIHDDIMDDAPLRRRKQSTFGKFGMEKAILAGDATLIMCYSLLQRVEDGLLSSRLISKFSQMALEVCEGQQLDMDFERMEDVSESLYTSMIEKKTGALLSYAMWAGACSAGASGDALKLMDQIGRLAGIGFQLQDDFLDYFSDHPRIGKQKWGDIIQKKKSIIYVLINYHLNDSEKKIFTEVYNGDSITERLNIIEKYVVKFDLEKILLGKLNIIQNELHGCLETLEAFGSIYSIKNLINSLLYREY